MTEAANVTSTNAIALRAKTEKVTSTFVEVPSDNDEEN